METRRYTIVLPDGTREGPYTWSHLKSLSQSGEIVPTTTILDGLRGETTAMDVPGVFEVPVAGSGQGKDMRTLDLLGAILAAISFVISFGLAYSVWAQSPHGSSETSIVFSFYSSPYALFSRFVVLVLGLIASVGIGQSKRWGFGLHVALNFVGAQVMINSIQLPWPFWSTTDFIARVLVICYSILRLLGCFGEPPKN